MTRHAQGFAASGITLALQAGFLVLGGLPVVAHAEDETVESLTAAHSVLEVGANSISTSSAKFGEYNGLNKNDTTPIGRLELRGGEAYGMGTGTRRWELNAEDLGTTSNGVRARISEQGQWSLGFSYDELRHNLSDSYQTPYLGSAGGNSFTLPTGFSTASDTNSLTTAQLAAMRNVDIETTRRNTAVNGSMEIDARWGLKFDYQHLDQSGSKLMAFGSASPALATTTTGEAVSILPNPTNYLTDTVNVALQWMGEQAHMTLAYTGSIFTEGYDRVKFTTFAGANTSETMSTPPGNDFHQLALNGGYAFTPKTKLTGSLSYGRNTQNDPFVVDSFMYVSGSSAAGNAKTSLNGVVLTTHGSLKLVDQTTKDLSLAASLKYDERNNQTASSIYNFQSLSNSTANFANYPNTPLSFSKTQAELAADYRLDASQKLRIAYNREDIRRWCDNYAVGGTNYYANTNCVVAVGSKDDKLGATYRWRANEDVESHFGYSYSNRETTSDMAAIVAMIGKHGGDIGSTLGTVAGLNGGDYIGFHPYFDASRAQQLGKAGVSWQANERLSFDMALHYTDDRYNSQYGVQDGNSWGANLDANYSYSDTGSVSSYVTQQSNRRDMTSLYRSIASGTSAASATAIKSPAGASWNNTLKTDDLTVGLGTKKSGLMGGKVDMAGDLSYSLGKSAYGTSWNYSATTTGGYGCSSAYFLTCGDLPEIRTELISLKITANYQVDKTSKWAVGYLYQKLVSSDYYYNGLQYGSTPSALMPTNQTAPTYEVNGVALTYIASF